MITVTDIKNFIRNNIESGTTLHISQIHTMIQQHFTLNNADWAPHTITRPTKYPKW